MCCAVLCARMYVCWNQNSFSGWFVVLLFIRYVFKCEYVLVYFILSVFRFCFVFFFYFSFLSSMHLQFIDSFSLLLFCLSVCLSRGECWSWDYVYMLMSFFFNCSASFKLFFILRLLILLNFPLWWWWWWGEVSALLPLLLFSRNKRTWIVVVVGAIVVVRLIRLSFVLSFVCRPDWFILWWLLHFISWYFHVSEFFVLYFSFRYLLTLKRWRTLCVFFHSSLFFIHLLFFSFSFYFLSLIHFYFHPISLNEKINSRIVVRIERSNWVLVLRLYWLKIQKKNKKKWS